MNPKIATILLIVCVVMFLSVAFWLGLRYLPFFDIRQIEIKYSGPVSDLGTDINRVVVPYKGINLFRADLQYLKKCILSFDGMEDVRISRFFPAKLIIEVAFVKYKARIQVSAENERLFYLADSKGMKAVSGETFAIFSLLPVVDLDKPYADYILKWGADNGFAQMCVLAETLGQKSLITSIKYDNNNTEDFGMMEIGMPSVRSSLCVREPVAPERLSEALDMIIRDGNPLSVSVMYDLYSNAMIKRK